jgi:phosphoglucomutase
VKVADEFTYLDPIDGSISRNQGLRILFTDGSRIVYRLSGTAGSGATIRVYLEKYETAAERLLMHSAEALRELVDIALETSQLREITGFVAPTVIT